MRCERNQTTGIGGHAAKWSCRNTPVHTCACTQCAHTLAHIYAHTHTHTQIRTYTYTEAHPHVPAPTPACTYTCLHPPQRSPPTTHHPPTLTRQSKIKAIKSSILSMLNGEVFPRVMMFVIRFCVNTDNKARRLPTRTYTHDAQISEITYTRTHVQRHFGIRGHLI